MTKEKTGELIIWVSAVIVLIIGAYGSYQMNMSMKMTQATMNPQLSVKSVTIGSTVIEAEVASTTSELTLGLSNRKSLAADAGMLFVFDRPERYEFWMKEMNFPLDFIWISKDMKVIDLTKNVGPETFPKLYPPVSPVQYVLEVNSGFIDQNKIKTGDTVTF